MKKQYLKKIFQYMLAFVLTIMFLITIIMIFEGKKHKKISVSFIDGDGFITYLKIGNSNYPLWQYENREGVLLKGDKLYLKDGNEFEIEYSRILSFDIALNSKNTDSVLINDNGNKKIIKLKNGKYSYTLNVGMKEFVVDFFDNINYKMIILLIIASIIYFIIVCICINYFEKFYKIVFDGGLKVIDILKLLFALLFIYFSTFYILLLLLNIFIIIPIVCILGFFIYSLRTIICKRIPEIFIVFILTVGVTMAFALPAFHVPDEIAHYVKSYSILNKNDINGRDKNYIYFPKNITKIFDKYNMDIHSTDYTITAKEYFVDSSVKLDNKSTDTAAVGYKSTVGLSKLCYIPSAIINFICFRIGIPLNITFLLARIINLFVYAIIGFYALKIIPKFKMLFLAIMLLPITVQQAFGINQDSLTNSLFILSLSLIMSLIYSTDKSINRKKILILVLLSFLLGFCKIGYFAVFFLVLLIPKKMFTSKKMEVFIKISIIAPCLVLSAMKYLTVAGVTVEKGAYYPFSMIYTNPFNVINICLHTILGRFQLDFLTGLVDGFGWSTVWHKPLIQFVVTIITFILLMCSVEKEDNICFKKRVYFMVISLIMIGFIYASLLFGWTRVNAGMIEGLQSRYFIPITFILYMSISNRFLTLNFKNNNLVRVFGILTINILALFTIISSYY